MDLGLKNALFDESLLIDCWLVGLGGIFVMSCIWIYTSSVFITIMTVMAVIFSLGIAYFMYSIVFDMSFFPFMNLLAIVVLIGNYNKFAIIKESIIFKLNKCKYICVNFTGVGADDAFLFIKIWKCTVTERNCLNNLMAITLKHSAMSMFVTSLTTAGAFYASFISSITAIKCFG